LTHDVAIRLWLNLDRDIDNSSRHLSTIQTNINNNNKQINQDTLKKIYIILLIYNVFKSDLLIYNVFKSDFFLYNKKDSGTIRKKILGI